MSEPLFLSATIRFDIDGQDRVFEGSRVGVGGVMGLPWGDLDPTKFYGKEVTVNIDPHVHDEHEPLAARGVIVRSTFGGQDQMGIRFIHSDRSRGKFLDSISQFGIPAPAYQRKFPRIDVEPAVATFPLRAIGWPDLKRQPEFRDMMVFDICNLSLGGLKLKTQNPRARNISIDDEIGLVIEPRGDKKRQPIEVMVRVQHIVDDVDVASLNPMRVLGVQFSRIDQKNKDLFSQLVQDLLDQIQGPSSDRDH